MSKVIIIGAGHGGTQLAASLRELGYDGSIDLISKEVDLPYHKPPLSKSFITSSDAPLQTIRSDAFYEKHGITLRLGHQVAEIDRSVGAVRIEGGEALHYDRLILATGSRARRLDVPGADLPGVHYLRTADDARRLRSVLSVGNRVVVIGGGFIGLEAAAALADTMQSVTVVELSDRLLQRALGATAGAAIKAHLETLDVRVLCGTGISRIDAHDGTVTGVSLSEGEHLPADIVLVGIGGMPEISLAESSGLSVRNGVQTDTFLTTSDPSIYAIGDCVAFPDSLSGKEIRLESVQNATDQARAVAATLTGRPSPYTAVPWFWSDIGKLKLQIVGVSDPADDETVTYRDDGSLRAVWRFQGDRLTAVETLNSPREHMIARKLFAAGATPTPEQIRDGNIETINSLMTEKHDPPNNPSAIGL